MSISSFLASAGGGSILGSIGGGLLSLFGQNSANSQNAALSNTAYQRSSADMMAAGLNPAAMFGSGGPASSPVMQNPMAGPADAMRSGVSSAVQANIAEKTIDQLTSQIAKTEADRLNTVAATRNIVAGRPSIVAKAEQDTREWGAVKRIPDAVFRPVVQAGYGSHSLRDAGDVASGIAGVSASARDVLLADKDFSDGVSSKLRRASDEMWTANSAMARRALHGVSVYGEKAYDEASDYGRKLRAWMNGNIAKSKRYSTVYKSN